MGRARSFDLRRDKRRSSLIFILIIAAGIIAGAVFQANAPEKVSPWIHQYFVPMYSGTTLLSVIRGTLSSTLIFIAAAFLGGMFTLGQPLGVFLLLYRGFGAGEAIASMYSTAGISSLPAVLLLVVPKAAAILFISVIAVRELMRASGSILYYWVSDDCRDTGKLDLKLYCLKFGVLCLLSFVIAAADAAVNYIFSRFV